MLLSIIHAAEISAYSEWGHKLSSRVFMHLLNPDEVMRTTGFSKGALSLGIVLLESIGSFYVVNRLFRWVSNTKETSNTRSKIWSHALNGLGVISGLAFSFLLMRGGIQQIPINIDAAYFSNQAILNDLSVNSAYYFGNSFFYLTSRILKPMLNHHLPQKKMPW